MICSKKSEFLIFTGHALNIIDYSIRMTFITETETQKKPDDHSPLYRKDSLTPDPSSPVSSDQGKYPWILTKTQYYQTIRAGLYRDDKGTYHYLIRIKRLIPDEREICRRLHEEIRKNDAVSKSSTSDAACSSSTAFMLKEIFPSFVFKTLTFTLSPTFNTSEGFLILLWQIWEM